MPYLNQHIAGTPLEQDQCDGRDPQPADFTQIEHEHVIYEEDAVSDQDVGVAPLERSLGGRWTAEDTRRVLDRMNREILSLGPAVVFLYEDHFLDVITDPEYVHVWACAIRLDINYLRAGGSVTEDIDGPVSDIWEEVERYLDSGGPDLESDDETMVSGLTEEVISRGLKRKRVCSGTHEMCVVCQETLGERENDEVAVAGLGCGHEYHLDCIKRWLREKNICPLCKARVV